MEYLPMASDSLLFVAFGVALFYLKLNPAPVRNREPLFFAWCCFFTNLFLVLFFAIFRAWNSSMAEVQNYRLADIWANAVSWTIFGAGAIALYRALTPFTSRPEKPADSERRGRRSRDEADADAAGEEGSGWRDADRRDSRTPMEGSRLPSRRFGLNSAEDKVDPVLEAKVDDELSAEPELVLTKDDELPLEPPLEEPKVKTVSSAISQTRAAAAEPPKSERAERPKTERPPRPRSEIIPAVKKSGVGIPVTSGSRTNIPLATEPGSPAVEVPAPVSVPVASPASRSGTRPAASGIRPAAQSGTLKSLPPSTSADTPSKDQYLDK